MRLQRSSSGDGLLLATPNPEAPEAVDQWQAEQGPEQQRACSSAHLARLPGDAEPAFERLSIPSSQFRRGLVGGLQEAHQVALWIGAGPHGLVRQHELAQLLVEAGRRRLDSAVPVTLWRGIGVRIEHRFVHAAAPGRRAGHKTTNAGFGPMRDFRVLVGFKICCLIRAADSTEVEPVVEYRGRVVPISSVG